MSEQVYKTGKLKLIEKKPYETLEEQCKRILEEHNKDTELDFYDSYVEMFNDEFYYEYIILDDNIYKVIELNDSDCDNIYELYDNKDGTMNYVLSYYNGSCSFNEAIEYAFEKIENKNNESKLKFDNLELKNNEFLVIKFDKDKINPKELNDICKHIKENISNDIIVIPNGINLNKYDKNFLLKFKEKINKNIDKILEGEEYNEILS